MFRLFVPLALLCLSAAAAPSAADLARQIQDAGLDPETCYRVIEQNISKEDLRVYFTSGYLMFTRPINGIRTGAVFSSDVEAGDAEVLLLPPLRSERLSLAKFTGSPNLDEHFRSAILVFTDNSAAELLAKLDSSGAKRVPEKGAALASQWIGALNNVSANFEVREVEDLLNGNRNNGLFYMTLLGVNLGNFDVFYDPRAQDNILIGQIGERNGRSYFNIWTSFASRSRRKQESTALPQDVELSNYRIDAKLNPDLAISATTRLAATLKSPARAVSFAISQKMRVLDARIDGQPAEVFQRDSLRSQLIRQDGDQDFLVVAPNELSAGQHEFEIRHEGAVISTAGNQVYYVGSRATWYPRHGSEFTRYDLTFQYPKALGFVATGDIVEDRTDGEWRITRRKTDIPIRFASFNLGDYKSVTITHEPYKIEVYANRALEPALKPKPDTVTISPDKTLWVSGSSASPDATGRLEALARDVASAFDFMAGLFGPPPLKTLTVSPIPGGFGQGFPGLLYLSTLAYLDPAQRPPGLREGFEETFFSDLLDPHEVAHQWWGNLMIGAGYQDAWLMEALANYSALLYLENKKGPHTLETILDDFRNHLLANGPDGRSYDSAGPITWGYRLQNSQAPDAWHHIIYDKGAWVLHMLRRSMGDDKFIAMLKAICERYRYKGITTEQFRELAVEFLPPHSPDSSLTNFFDCWVYGTGIPTLKLEYSVHGSEINGTVTQSNVPDDFSARIPLEIQDGGQRSLYWIFTASDPVPFSIRVKSAGARVALDANDALITVKN